MTASEYVVMSLRLPRDLHRDVRVAAFERRVAMNSLIVAAVEKARAEDFPAPEVNGTITEENGELSL